MEILLPAALPVCNARVVMSLPAESMALHPSLMVRYKRLVAFLLSKYLFLDSLIVKIMIPWKRIALYKVNYNIKLLFC